MDVFHGHDLRRSHLRQNHFQERSELASVASFVACPVALLTFLMPLLLALARILRGPLALRSTALSLRSWCLLLMLGRSSLRLLPLVLGSRPALLRSRLAGEPLTISASRLRRLSTRGRWSALLDRRWRAGTVSVLLCGSSVLWGPLPPLRRRRGRTLHALRLIVLLHYGIARLITVILALKHRLLLRVRISIP